MHNYANQAVIKCQFIRDPFFVSNENEAWCLGFVFFPLIFLFTILSKWDALVALNSPSAVFSLHSQDLVCVSPQHIHWIHTRRPSHNEFMILNTDLKHIRLLH